MLGGEGPPLLLRDVRADLQLVDVGRRPGVVDHPLQVRRGEVRRSDRPHQAVATQLHQPVEGVDVAVLVRIRPVDEQQVEVVEAEAFKACLAGPPGALKTVPLLVELRGDEQFLARHAGAAQPTADAALVLVVLRSVDEPVARLNRGRYHPLGGGVVHRPGPEPELRNADAVRERKGGGDGCAHGCGPCVGLWRRVARWYHEARCAAVPGQAIWRFVRREGRWPGRDSGHAASRRPAAVVGSAIALSADVMRDPAETP